MDSSCHRFCIPLPGWGSESSRGLQLSDKNYFYFFPSFSSKRLNYQLWTTLHWGFETFFLRLAVGWEVKIYQRIKQHFFFSSSCEHQHGRVGKLQYFSGTSACARHGLLLGDAIAGGELAAGESLRVTIGLLVRINKPCLFAHMDLMQTFTTSQCARMSKHAVSLYKLLRVVVYCDDESAVLLLSY